MKIKIPIISIIFVIFGLGLSLALAFCAYIAFHLSTEKDLRVSFYSVEADVQNPIRILQFSDLHNSEFGENNEELCELVRDQKPDLIFITGDMINRDNQDVTIIENLVTRLLEIAPVYYGYGNHETTWDETLGTERGTSIEELLTAKGAVVLNLDYKDVFIKGSSLRIGGYMGYYRYPGMMEGSQELWEDDNQFFDDFENTDSYKILLNHIPTQWVDWGHLDDFDVDLIFSGHYHGGQWVLPWVGPVYAPYVAWFPEHVKGCFTGEKGSCILSAGLGNEYTYLTRVNNPPEVVVVDLVPGK